MVSKNMGCKVLVLFVVVGMLSAVFAVVPVNVTGGGVKASSKTMEGYSDLTGAPVVANAADGMDPTTGYVRTYIWNRSNEIPSPGAYGAGINLCRDIVSDGTTPNSYIDNAFQTDLAGFTTEWDVAGGTDVVIAIIDIRNATSGEAYTCSADVTTSTGVGGVQSFYDSGTPGGTTLLQKIPSPTFTGSSVDWTAVDDGWGNVYGYRVYGSATETGTYSVIGNSTTTSLSYTPTVGYWYNISVLYRGKQGGVQNYATAIESVYAGKPAQVPAANNPPTLTNGAVAPNPGQTTDTFTYNVTYKDTDGNPPAAGYPKVNILKGGSPIGGSPFAMTWQSGTNITGANYRYSKVGLAEGSDYTFYFNASDSLGAWATQTTPQSGPTVTAPAYLPQQIGISTSNTVYTPTTAKAMTADETWTLYCWGYNSTAIPAWFDLVSAASWNVNTIAAGSGTLSASLGTITIFNATTVGTCNVSATYTGLPTNYTATITISAGAFAKIIITNLTGGSPWFAGTTIPSGNTISLNASGYDSDGNYKGLAECTWTVTGGIGTVPLGTGTSKIFTATTAGSGTVTAANATTPSITNSTGIITVTVPYQPDLLLEGDGNGVYYTNATVTGTVQDKSVTLSAGQSKNWTIILQNDGTQLPGDTITVRWWVATQTAGWTGTAQMYNGTTPITSPYLIGIPAGGSVTLKLNVTANGGVGDYCDIRVNATSGGTGNPQDCVRTVTSLPAAAEAWWIATWDCPSPASTGLTYTISVAVYNNYSAGQQFTVSLTITGATTYSNTTQTAALAVGQTGWANFTEVIFNAGDSVVTVQVTTPPGNPSTKTVTTKAVTIPPAPTTSFEPTVIGIGIAVLVVAVLGTAVIWKKKKEKKKTEK